MNHDTSASPDNKDFPVRPTIAAIATPLGRGGVGIVRISGPASRAVLDALFVPTSTSFNGFEPRKLHHGTVRDPNTRAVLDETLAVLMPAPHSFTGEDVAEFQCHGGPAVLASVLEACFAAGAQPAGPGEFTRRAFLNGRMDLTRAEAVAEVIEASTRQGAHLAQAKLSGMLGERIAALRLRLEELRAQLCVAVDFPEEEIECLSPEEFSRGVEEVLEGVAGLLENYERSRCWRDGALVVLAGRVNAGKSSLLNALLGRNRAIVSDTPGTTRDFIEETLNLGGLPVRMVDTAGLRVLVAEENAQSGIEREGMQMGRELMARADLVVLVADCTEPLDGEDAELARSLARDIGTASVLVAANKLDLLGETGPMAEGPGSVLASEGFSLVRISARTGQGLDELVDAIRTAVTGGRTEPDPGELVPNLRQSQALGRASEELEALLSDLGAAIPYDLLGVRLEAACVTLSEITGEIASEDVINAVFDAFCIGK